MSKGWFTSVTPPKNTLIQFIVKRGGKYGEYWGQYDGLYRGYVSSEMPFPMDFNSVYAWKKTHLSVMNGKLSFKLNKQIEGEM